MINICLFKRPNENNLFSLNKKCIYIFKRALKTSINSKIIPGVSLSKITILDVFFSIVSSSVTITLRRKSWNQKGRRYELKVHIFLKIIINFFFLFNDNMLFKAEADVDTEINSMAWSLNCFRLLQIINVAVVFMACDSNWIF